jgi:hypothetical protein
MRAKLLFFTGALFAIVGRIGAGSLELQPKEAPPPNIAQSEPWQFTIAAPGWWAGLNGTIGVNGVNADINIGFDQILQHLDMIFAARAEAQKGPFGIYGEVIYIGLSDGAQINGLVNHIHAQVDQTLVDTALSWRLVNQPRWSLDFAAGTHYTSLYERLTLSGNPNTIHQASERFVDDVSADLRDRLDADISRNEFVAALGESIRSVIISRIGDRFESAQRHPNIPVGPLGGRLRQEVRQIVENYVNAKLGALQRRIDALHLVGDARRAAVNRIVNATKAQMTQDLSRTLIAKFNQSLSKDNYWFDPYVGMRGRYNFNKTYYTAVRGEIGGFGVGADLMWEVEGVVGINLTRSIFTEVGYRALGADYENDGLLFDVVMHGPQITTGITF